MTDTQKAFLQALADAQEIAVLGALREFPHADADALYSVTAEVLLQTLALLDGYGETTFDLSTLTSPHIELHDEAAAFLHI